MNQYELIKNVMKYGHKAFGLSTLNIAFLATLLSYYDHNTKQCFPKNDSVKNGCGLDASNLHRNKKALRDAGLITTFNKNMGDKKKHSGYILHTDVMEARFAAIAYEEGCRAASETINDVELFDTPESVAYEPEAEEQSPFESNE